MASKPQELSGTQQKRLAEFIEPFRVTPGAKVTLAKDFDPAFKAGVDKKKDGVRFLEEGVQTLADYQARLASPPRNRVACSSCSRRSTPGARTGRSATS